MKVMINVSPYKMAFLFIQPEQHNYTNALRFLWGFCRTHCCYSVMSNSLRPVDCSTPGLYVPHHLHKFAQVHVHYVSDASQPSQLLTPSSPSALHISQIQGLFQRVSYLHQMTKILEFQLQHQSFQWISRVDFLAIQGILRSLLQHHSSKASILWHSAFFTVQLLKLQLTTGKTIALTIQTFVSGVMSLIFNIVQVCHSFPASKQKSSDFMAEVTIRSDFRAQEEEICLCFHLIPLYLP